MRWHHFFEKKKREKKKKETNKQANKKQIRYHVHIACLYLFKRHGIKRNFLSLLLLCYSHYAAFTFRINRKKKKKESESELPSAGRQ
jgi:hypothetical protein